MGLKTAWLFKRDDSEYSSGRFRSKFALGDQEAYHLIHCQFMPSSFHITEPYLSGLKSLPPIATSSLRIVHINTKDFHTTTLARC
jgi:hypothetical protein